MSRKAGFGVILDGDGDRILFVDEKGRGIENYFLSCLVAEELLARSPGASIVYDLISSRVLPERIQEMGESRWSHVSATRSSMTRCSPRRRFSAPRPPGHVYFKVSDTYYTESAAYALAVILGLLAKKNRPLSELVQPLRSRYAQSPEINVEVADKEKAMAEVEKTVRQGHGSTGWTASPSSSTTSGSMCGRATPSPFCACGWRRAAARSPRPAPRRS